MGKFKPHIVSDNGVSKVWIDNGFIYKQQPKHLTQNEIWCLKKLAYTGYVPKAERADLELIRMEWIRTGPVTRVTEFLEHYKKVIAILKSNEIRHGDLTNKNVLVRNNKPIIIDFAESRLFCDPRADKRPEGDMHWLSTTMENYAKNAITPNS